MPGRWMLVAGLSCGVAYAAPPKVVKSDCRRIVLEGDVKAGQGFQRMFAKGLEFTLEPLASGWIVRVLPVGVARGPHDAAELATPPYMSVTPLAVSTDFSFRAQDAISWNPRRFKYAATAGDFAKLSALYPRVMANDAGAMSEAAVLAERQPEGVLEILNAVIVPGTNDQWKMAAAVASHFLSTPHEVVQGEAPTKLGRVAEMQFRVRLMLPVGVEAAKDVEVEKIPCAARPTG